MFDIDTAALMNLRELVHGPTEYRLESTGISVVALPTMLVRLHLEVNEASLPVSGLVAP